MLERLKSDAAAAFRSLSRMPLLVVGAVFILAISAGVNLAMFGLINRALLSPPAQVADPGRVFALAFGAPGDLKGEARMSSTSYVTFTTIREQVTALKSAAAFQRVSPTLILDGDQLNPSVMLVSGNYFDVLGARPVFGRGIDPDSDNAGAQPVVALSNAFWRSAFASDPNVLGRRLMIDGLDYTVAGVMPPGFSGHSTIRVDVWAPFAAAMRNSPGWDREAFRNMAGIVARLAPGQSEVAATTQAAAATRRPVALTSIVGSEVAPSEQRVAFWLFGVSVLILAIGLANAATLLGVRGARTHHDMTIRTALGASRRRLMSQAGMEAVFIAIAGTVSALVLASLFDESVRRVLFPGVLTNTGTSPATMWAGAVTGVLGALVSAAASIWHLPSNGGPSHLSAGRTADRRRTRATSALLLVQTTLSVVLLSGAGLFGASLYRLWAQDFGMRMADAVVIDFEPGPTLIDSEDEFFTEALDRIRHLPGVELATPIDSIPFSGFNVPPISVPGRAEPPAMGQQLPFLTGATPEFLRILGIQIAEGRGFTDADDRGPRVVLVNQTMARSVWPGESAIGKCIRIGFDPDFNPQTFDPSSGPPMPSAAVPCREVIGVTRDVRQRSVLPFDGEDRWMQYFVPLSQIPAPPFAPNPTRIRGLLLRANADVLSLAPAIRRLILSSRTDLPYLRIRPYTQLLDRQMRPWTIGTRLLGLFSALALLVAAVGLYAAFAQAVSERGREMAIRMAVGAGPNRVLAMVMREAAAIACVGAGVGCVAAVLAGRWAQSLLFGTEPSDPLVLGSAAAMMVLVAVLSTLAPALSASKAEPSVLLRSE